jgi:hypothetical protein
LHEIETYAQARLGGNRPAETTGKLLFASFQHDAARPDRKDGYAAPTCILITSLSILHRLATENKVVATARNLQMSAVWQGHVPRQTRREFAKAGYEIQVDKRTGAPEIVGISREYIEASSPRQREIKEAQCTGSKLHASDMPAIGARKFTTVSK